MFIFQTKSNKSANKRSERFLSKLCFCENCREGQGYFKRLNLLKSACPLCTLQLSNWIERNSDSMPVFICWLLCNSGTSNVLFLFCSSKALTIYLGFIKTLTYFVEVWDYYTFTNQYWPAQKAKLYITLVLVYFMQH